jgi:RHS repeat-associated protein
MMNDSILTRISLARRVRRFGSLLVTAVAAALIISMFTPLTAGATASPTSHSSRLYVGSTLRPGAQSTSTSGVYQVDVLTRGRVEVLKHGHVAWRSGAVSEIAHAMTTGISDSTHRVASNAITDSAATAPSYLTMQNDGDVALVTKAGVPKWQGGLRARLSGLTEAPYTANAFYGDTNPSVTCYTCYASEVTGSAPPSNTVDSGTGVNAMTGDFSTSNALFDAPAIGSDLSLSLGYDAQLAQSELSNGTTGLTFGEGWSSNFSSSMTPSGYNVTINQGNGSEATFTQTLGAGVSTSCELSGDPSQYAGDYPFTAKYTISGSPLNFCALDSVQGQLSENPSTGFTYQVGGGASIQNYAWNGQLVGVTSNTAQSVSGGTVAQGLAYYSASAGTLSEGGITLSSACPGTATYGCTIFVAHDGRDIVEVLNNLGEVTEVIDPAGNTYTMTYSSTSYPNNLTSVTVPNPTGTGTSTWTYEYSTSSSPYGSDLVQIYDPDASSPTGFSSGALHSTTINYGTGTFVGMVTSLVDGGGQSATTSYSYASGCATGACTSSNATQTTTILYPAECPSPGITCTATSWPTAAADTPQEIDQYTSGIETSSQLGSQTNPSEVETWLYSWNFGNGVANTSEQITYPDTLQGTSPVLQSETIVTDPAGNIISTTNPLGDVSTSSYNESSSLNIPEMAWSYPGPSSNTSSSPPTGSSQYKYNTFGQVVTSTDPLGHITYYGYYANYSLLCYEVSPILATSPALGWTSSTSPPSCTSSSTVYDAGAIGAPTGAITYSYDEQGDVVGQTIDAGDTGANADPQTTTASYDPMGNILWEIPPAGQSGSQSSSNSYATSYAYVAHTSLPSDRYQPSGITTQYGYDAAGNLAYSGNNGAPQWVFTTTTYDGDNRPCYQIEAYGNTGNCGDGNAQGSTSWTYEPGTTNVYQTADSNSDITTNYYADLAFPNSTTEVQDSGNVQDQYSAYNDYGEACVYGDAAPTLGSTQCSTTPSGDTAATYDALGNELTITDPSANTTTNVYEDASYPTLETQSKNSMGANTKYAYDADGNLVTTTNPDGTGVTQNYNANGKICNKMPALIQFPCGQGPSVAGVTQYGYNNANELTSMSDNTGNPATPTLWSQSTTYTYTGGQLTSTTDDNGKTVNYAYNHAGEVSCIAYPVSTSTNCSSTASGTNTIVKRSFDGLGRISSVTDWLGNTTSYTYADSSTPTTPTTITYPTATGVTANYGYDNAGNLNALSASSTVTSGTAISDTWQFDSDERLVVSSINGSTGSWAGYNANKQITAAPNLATSTSDDTYTVAANGAITSDAAPSGSTTSSGYNAGSELCWQANVAAASSACGSPPAPAPQATSYSYTTNGQRASAATTTGAIAPVGTLQTGNANGDATQSVDPQNVGDAIVLGVELLSSSVTVSSISGGGSTWRKLTSNSTGGDDNELWLGTVATTGSSTITVTYSGSVSSDWIELSAQEYSDGFGASASWTTDTSGVANTTSSSTTVALPSLTPSGANELYVGLASVDNYAAAGSTTGFTYELTPAGNMLAFNPNVSSSVSPTATQSPSGTYKSIAVLLKANTPATATTHYAWNPYGELCNVSAATTACGTAPTSGTAYTYNGDGLRMTAATTSSTTDSTWDSVAGGSIPLNINDATTTGSSTTNTSYIYGDLLFGGTAPIEQITTTSSGTSVSYLVSNQSGVQGVYNGSGSSLGAVQEMAVYSLYGNQTISSGSKVTPFGYQGSYNDSTGLIYLINRYYDPATDQFLSIDPDVATTDQPYVFTNDNPLNSTDPLGDGVKEKTGKIFVCLIFTCQNGLAQVDTVFQPSSARGQAPTEQGVKEKNGTEERTPTRPQDTEQPVSHGENFGSMVLNNLSSELQAGLKSPVTKVAAGAAAVGGVGWGVYILFGLALA